MATFDHTRLQVYQLALRFAGEVDPILRRMPGWRWPLRAQLQRAAPSILLNIAEGAGEHSRRDKARFYRMARRSATECAAMLDLLHAVQLATAEEVDAHQRRLHRIVAMLTVMARRLETQPSSGGAAAAVPRPKAGAQARSAGAQGP